MSSGGTVLVAGSAGGIGSACMRRLGADGYDVVGIDRTDGVDVTRPGGAEEALEAATNGRGPLRAVVHAIGMSGRKLGDGMVSECTDEAWSEVMRVNLESAFRLLRSSLPAVQPGGSIVLVGSALAHRSDPDFLTAAYAASKAGLEGLTRVAAREGTSREVRVNCVAAALVDTPMASRALTDPHIVARLPELQPLGGRALSPDEVAGVVSWLVSDDAAPVTGACIPADRGWML